eukprot:gene9532-10536_t
MARKKALTKKAPKAESTLHDFLIPAITRQASIKQSDQHRLHQEHHTTSSSSGSSIRVIADLDGPSSRRNQFHPNAQRNLQALVPKRFVFKKKRPKGLSRLKKRILMERVRQQEKMTSTGRRKRREKKSYPTSENCSRLSLLSSSAVFPTSETAQGMVKTLNGFVVAGTPLVAQLSDQRSIRSASNGVESSQTPSSSSSSSSATADNYTQSDSFLLRLLNVVEVEDCVEAAQEDLQEVLNDLLSLLNNFPTVRQAVKSLSVCEVAESPSDCDCLGEISTNAASCDPFSFNAPLILLDIWSGQGAINISRALHGTVVGGETLAVSFCSLDEATLPFSTHSSVTKSISMLNFSELEDSCRTYYLVFNSFATGEEWEDEDEAREIVNNLHCLLENKFEDSALFAAVRTIDQQQHVVVDFYLKLPSLAVAVQCFDQLLSRILFEKLLRVAVITIHPSIQQTIDEMIQRREVVDEWIDCPKEILCDHQVLLSNFHIQTHHCHSVLSLDRYITTEDWEDLEASSGEDMLAIKTDLLGLLQSERDFIRGMHIITPTATTSSKQNAKLGGTASVDILFSSFVEAQQAMAYLDGMVMGGCTVGAYLQQSAVRLSLDSPHIFAVLDVDSVDLLKTKQEEVSAQPVGEEIRCIHEELSSSLHDSWPAMATTTAGVEEEVGGKTCSTSMPADSSKVHGKYRLAKEAPRLALHDGPAHSSIPIATPEIEQHVKSFLTMLSNFQQRLKERNPLDYKKKQRFVTGLRQVAQSIKAGRARLIILAPNTEVSEELDLLIDGIIANAQSKAIPLLYALNKRQLGKALQMTMKQSVVSIFDPDGAYDLYRQIIHFINPAAEK